MAEQWSEPGVRLAQQVNIPVSPGDLASAVPVFMGWPQQGATGGRAVPGVPGVLYVLGTLEDWPWATHGEAGAQCLYQTVSHYFDNGGAPCYVLALGWWESGLAGAQAREKGLTDPGASPTYQVAYQAVLAEPAITLVALPQLGEVVDALPDTQTGSQVNPPTGGGGAPGSDADPDEKTGAKARKHVALWAGVLTALQTRRDLFFVFDAPRDPQVASACVPLLWEQQALGERGQFAALYGPYLVSTATQPGPVPGQSVPVIVPPSGAVLALIERTDQESGVWTAPANAPLLHVLRPEKRETQAQGWFDVSRPSINLIRSFPGRGVRVWGCRTLAPDTGSPMRYVQARRLVTYIEANLQDISRFAVFEPNSALTWFKLEGLISTWLHTLWHEGGLAGAQAQQAYQVLVGLGRSMTMADVQGGRMVVKVRVALLHAAEFVDLSLVLNVGESQLVAAS
ncbi:hypothetical protein [Paraburkholderia aspalathi]|uniref:hypothetical protein n=1 Tax=Paraburkholderia aspalathi TaxID=1324617 RepID=UPI0038B722A3